jgi:hypothetical protein
MRHPMNPPRWRPGMRVPDGEHPADHDTLLAEAARFCRAVEALFVTLPPERYAAHLSDRARDIASRIERDLRDRGER